MQRAQRSKEDIQAAELAKLNTLTVKSVEERERDYNEARTRLGLDSTPQVSAEINEQNDDEPCIMVCPPELLCPSGATNSEQVCEQVV